MAREKNDYKEVEQEMFRFHSKNKNKNTMLTNETDLIKKLALD
jgi:hypothetical protein